MNLRRFSDEDLPGLLALQHAHAGGGARWSAAHLASELHHPARGGGAQVLIAEREGGVAGGAGWVEAGADFFVSPLFAADAAAATALVERLVARATEVGAARVRCSATTADGPKIAALGAAGFEPILDFITLARPAAEVIVPALPWRRVPLGDCPITAVRELHNETFAGVPNAAPVDDAEMAHDVAGAWPEGSGVWLDEAGAPASFLLGRRARDGATEVAVVDSVGVRAVHRGRGAGRVAVAHLLAAAVAAGLPEARAMIASTNEASLALHRALGFAERFRVTSYQLALARGGDV